LPSRECAAVEPVDFVGVGGQEVVVERDVVVLDGECRLGKEGDAVEHAAVRQWGAQPHGPCIEDVERLGIQLNQAQIAPAPLQAVRRTPMVLP
jgi:hypothetical protein